MPNNEPSWAMLRSDIYIRDKGICWICNEFVELKDYELGHLVDRMNGGQDAYDNLAVMHAKCNLSKPRHKTLEEAMRWKLTPSYLTRPQPNMILQPSTSKIPIARHRKRYDSKSNHYSEADRQAIRELIIEYFNNRPELLANGDKYNRERIIASKQLAQTLGITRADIRMYLRESGLVKKRAPQITDGSQYHYVFQHLDELLVRYGTVKKTLLFDQPKLMGIPPFYMDIMFLLSGQTSKVSRRNLQCIQRRVQQLNIPIRHNANFT